MPGQSWTASAAMFQLMWLTMMVAMMLPSLVPKLQRYRNAVGRRGETSLGRLTTLVGVGYFFVWMLFGIAAFHFAVFCQGPYEESALYRGFMGWEAHTGIIGAAKNSQSPKLMMKAGEVLFAYLATLVPERLVLCTHRDRPVCLY